MKKARSLTNVKNLTLLALMTALVAVFQCIGLIIPIGFNVGAFALVPIVIGAAMLGPVAGLWLGFIFGLVVIVTGQASAFYAFGVVQTVIVVLLKGALAGWVSGLMFKLIEKKNSLAAIITSSILCPVVNTAVFTLASFTIFFPGIKGWATGAGKDMISFVFLTLIGANFFVELGICLIFSTVAHRIILIGKKMRSDKSYI
ncbi:MAG: ECF transporter S component [Ruminococcaceae bacterium]|nr:ECF transporter S component [Oscillospiraceae bacterium]